MSRFISYELLGCIKSVQLILFHEIKFFYGIKLRKIVLKEDSLAIITIGYQSTSEQKLRGDPRFITQRCKKRYREKDGIFSCI